jgi:hypothetical protein
MMNFRPVGDATRFNAGEIDLELPAATKKGTYLSCIEILLSGFQERRSKAPPLFYAFRAELFVGFIYFHPKRKTSVSLLLVHLFSLILCRQPVSVPHS